ncbi:hypothetical protein RRG08_045289 [Elysia crispata]|uniref:Uncharacterized protein n=1 Tax=Elysia crispata TaxID=231223 RepID=A0AAE1A1F0_9GAST|nr:hypothetical protein RRG08_045289 [Elysia crispata]
MHSSRVVKVLPSPCPSVAAASCSSHAVTDTSTPGLVGCSLKHPTSHQSLTHRPQAWPGWLLTEAPNITPVTDTSTPGLVGCSLKHPTLHQSLTHRPQAWLAAH